MGKHLKFVGAVVLLASLALPMSTCRRYVTVDGKPIIPGREGPPKGAREVLDYGYALESFDPTDWNDWGTLLAFTWPLIAFAVLVCARSKVSSVVVRILEPALIVWSFAFIDFLSSFLETSKAVGAYVAFAGLGLYTLGTVWSDLSLFLEWRGRRARAR